MSDVEVNTETDEYRCRNPAPNVPQYLDESRGVYKMMDKRLKSEIAQRELSDLGRRSLAL
jgi:hypothetical protein